MNLPNVWPSFQGRRGLGKPYMNGLVIFKATVKGFTELGAIVKHPPSARGFVHGHCSVESLTDVKCWGVF